MLIKKSFFFRNEILQFTVTLDRQKTNTAQQKGKWSSMTAYKKVLQKIAEIQNIVVSLHSIFSKC